MFDLKENECVGFESKWRVKKVSTVNATQTSEYKLKEIETQTCTKAEIETQTENTQLPDTDMQKVADWLAKIYPRVKKELNDANNSQAFKNYSPIFENVEANAKLVQTINVSSRPDNSSDEIALRVSAMSWNCTGKTLAVSCNFVHKNWCHHVGRVKFYSLTKDDTLSEKPIKKLTTNSCVTHLQYHPNLQFIIAGGLYSGGVIIWNIEHNSGDGILCKVNAHEDGITQIAWVNDTDPLKTLLLATSSLDGTLNMWNFSFPNSSLTIKEKYKIKPPLLGRIRQNELTAPEIANKINRGIITFDFSPYLLHTFVVGVEGGLVVQCSALGCNSLSGSTPHLPISDPVYKYYDPHEGEIQMIKFSPNRREMFLTLATLGEIRIYVLGQEEPAQVIFLEKPLMTVSWISFEEKLICGCGEKGILEIFDVIKARPMKNVSKDVLKSCVLTQMALNNQRPTSVVTGSNIGIIHLWNVPWHQFSIKI